MNDGFVFVSWVRKDDLIQYDDPSFSLVVDIIRSFIFYNKRASNQKNQQKISWV